MISPRICPLPPTSPRKAAEASQKPRNLRNLRSEVADGRQRREQQATGQKFEVLNSGTILHKSNWTASNPLINSGDNKPLQPKTGAKPSSLEMAFRPCKPKEVGGVQTITFACNVHTWMRAYA